MKDENRILTREEASRLSSFKEYDNGDYRYTTPPHHYHLIRDGKDLFEGQKVVWVYNCSNGIYKYRTSDDHFHLLIDGKDVLKDKKATMCVFCPNGNYKYQVEFKDWHFYNKAQEELNTCTSSKESDDTSKFNADVLALQEKEKNTPKTAPQNQIKHSLSTVATYLSTKATSAVEKVANYLGRT